MKLYEVLPTRLALISQLWALAFAIATLFETHKCVWADNAWGKYFSIILYLFVFRHIQHSICQARRTGMIWLYSRVRYRGRQKGGWGRIPRKTSMHREEGGERKDGNEI